MKESKTLQQMLDEKSSKQTYLDTRSKEKCLIDKLVQDEIDRGVPESLRTKAWFVSCPCSKCTPFYM